MRLFINLLLFKDKSHERKLMFFPLSRASCFSLYCLSRRSTKDVPLLMSEVDLKEAGRQIVSTWAHALDQLACGMTFEEQKIPACMQWNVLFPHVAWLLRQQRRIPQKKNKRETARPNWLLFVGNFSSFLLLRSTAGSATDFSLFFYFFPFFLCTVSGIYICG